MLLRVGGAAAVRNGVLLCAAVGVCALRVLCVRLRKEQKFAQLVECKRHESRPWQNRNAAVAVCAGGFMLAKGVNARPPCASQLFECQAWTRLLWPRWQW